MCFSVEPKAKYYYQEEIIPARPHRHHHHHHHHSPRASYTTVDRYSHSHSHSPRVSSSSYRRSVPARVVYEEPTRVVYTR
ncbi:hypothetical protein HDV57DRAFT_484827 [Trichoderma longibrachiatum]|uniref:Uncharacterized protein n=1 Tax=Trichoderma longibrachiatum ATCC 18648 TaxID=983965 RepID=A0A2T4CD69_TRILO|nr:hypothetical protein M440DRAFT_1398816 [Trichoderma longibrachiatum ATCC 18648]